MKFSAWHYLRLYTPNWEINLSRELLSNYAPEINEITELYIDSEQRTRKREYLKFSKTLCKQTDYQEIIISSNRFSKRDVDIPIKTF